eukprot:2478406-Pleurochrysis_carterae.AAC.2
MKGERKKRARLRRAHEGEGCGARTIRRERGRERGKQRRRYGTGGRFSRVAHHRSRIAHRGRRATRSPRWWARMRRRVLAVVRVVVPQRS